MVVVIEARATLKPILAVCELIEQSSFRAYCLPSVERANTGNRSLPRGIQVAG